MKVCLPITLLLSIVIGNSNAQSLSPTVVSTSGAFYSNGSGMLSSTIGEMAMVETFSNGSAILNQGFQQAFDFATGIHNSTVRNEMNIFPNPTSGNVTIRVLHSFTGEVNANVYDAIGKLVFSKTEKLTVQENTFMLSLDNFVDGMYLLELQTNSESYSTKINLIK
jgi:hypothetical protein